MRIGGLAAAIGAGENPNAAVVTHVHVIDNERHLAIGVLYLVQRQIEVVRRLYFTDTLCHGRNVWATDRQAVAVQALHEPHSRQIKGQIATQGG